MSITRFNPEIHGFRFNNSFRVSANRIGPLPDIHFAGLCGGMSYAALDFFFAAVTVPTERYRPLVGTPLEEFIFKRQNQSTLGSAANLARWAELTLNLEGVRNAEFYGWAIGERLAELRRHIDGGRPVPLGLKGADGRGDHQVVAIGYEMGRYAGDKGAHQEDLQILVYDPNHPAVACRIRAKSDSRKLKQDTGESWQGYFVDSEYRPVAPPSLSMPPTYPVDGLVHELHLEITTGGDDLRGGNDNVHAEIGFAGGGIQKVENINRRQRWIDHGTEHVVIPLQAPTDAGRINSVTLRTTFGGAFNDNWNVDALRIFLLRDNVLIPVFDRSGSPLVRFDSRNKPFVAALPPSSRPRNLKSLRAVNRQFVCAEGGGGRELVANRNVVGSWEKFEVVNQPAGRIALQAANGQFVCAEDGGGREVVANRDAIGPWETFELLRQPDGKVALRCANGQFVCAEGGGGAPLVANRQAIGPWEKFELTDAIP